jgi:hypothetical protein
MVRQMLHFWPIACLQINPWGLSGKCCIYRDESGKGGAKAKIPSREEIHFIVSKTYKQLPTE